MSQETQGTQPITDRMSGLDQSLSPTIEVGGLAFSMRGVVERNKVLQRLGGKVAALKKEGDVFHIHFMPDGTYMIHVYGVGLIWVQ